MAGCLMASESTLVSNFCGKKIFRTTRGCLCIARGVLAGFCYAARHGAEAEHREILREALLVADHNAYHLGALVVVRRLLGAWK